jgi:hypothetical protein
MITRDRTRLIGQWLGSGKFGKYQLVGKEQLQLPKLRRPALGVNGYFSIFHLCPDRQSPFP